MKKEIPAVYLIAAIITVTLLSTLFITFITTIPEKNQSETIYPYTQNSGLSSSKETVPIGSVLRILRYDSDTQTYRFTDHKISETTLLSQIENLEILPLPDNKGPVTPAMIQLVDNTGTTRTIRKTVYLVNVEKVQNILNRYSKHVIITPTKTPTPTPTEKTVVKPVGTAEPGMIIPFEEYTCNNKDGTCTAHFSYRNFYDYPVSLPNGAKNTISPAPDNRGQPTVFLAGYNYDAFTVDWPSWGTNLVWTIGDKTAVAKPVEAVKAGFKTDKSGGYIPLTVSFTDLSTGSTDKNPLNYSWDFGDGETAETKDAVHTYRSPGKYKVKQHLQNRCENITTEITISAYDSDFYWGQQIPHSYTYRFVDSSSGDPSMWFWNFGHDDETSFEQNPVHTFPRGGIYPVSLTVSGPAGTKEVVKKVEVA